MQGEEGEGWGAGTRGLVHLAAASGPIAPLEECVSGMEEAEEYLPFLPSGSQAHSDTGSLLQSTQMDRQADRKENLSLTYTIILCEGGGHADRRERMTEALSFSKKKKKNPKVSVYSVQSAESHNWGWYCFQNVTKLKTTEENEKTHVVISGLL